MKSRNRLIVGTGILISLVVILLVSAMYFTKPANLAVDAAKKALYASVDYPDSVRIIAISKPDSVFGRDYVSDEERMNLTLTMLKVNEYLMTKTEDLDQMDLNDASLNDLMTRQMSASNMIRSLMHSGIIRRKGNPFTGYKVKIEYEGVSGFGNKFHAEYWFIIDRSGRHVINSFEIPVL